MTPTQKNRIKYLRKKHQTETITDEELLLKYLKTKAMTETERKRKQREKEASQVVMIINQIK